MPIGLDYFEDWPERPNCGHFFGGAHWYGSDTASPIFVFAALANSPEYDSKRTGCSKEVLRELALKGIRYLCFTHDTGPAECIRPQKSLGNPRTWGTKWGERGRGFFPESQCGTNVADIALTALLLGEYGGRRDLGHDRAHARRLCRAVWRHGSRRAAFTPIPRWKRTAGRPAAWPRLSVS